MGGIARRVRWIREDIKVLDNPIIVDSGDSFGGLYVDKKDEAMGRARLLMQLYKKTQYSCVAVGAKDLDELPLEFLKKEAKKMGLTLLSANVFVNGKRPFKPYKIVEQKGVKIAFIGITDDFPLKSKKTLKFKVIPPAQVIQDITASLKGKVDVMVLLTDLGQRKFRRIVKEKPLSVDIAILSGRGKALREPIYEGKTWILAPMEKGKGIGIAEVLLDNEKKVLEIKNKIVLLRGYLPVDQEAQKMVDAFMKEYGITHEVLKKRVRKERAMENPFLRALMKAKQKRQKISSNGTKGAGSPVSSNPFMELIKKETSKKKTLEGNSTTH